MKFKKHGWLSKAIATPRGLCCPKKGTLLKRWKMTPSEIVEWNGWEDKVPAECKVEEPKVEVKEEVEVEVVEKEMCDCKTCDGVDCDCDCHKGFFERIFS